MHRPLRVLVGSLGPGMLPDAASDPPTGTVLLDLGADHPSTAGLLELALWTEDDVVTAATVHVGAMHRGAEKLFEVRDYRQIGMLADRHDWQAPFSGELGVALLCEQLLGLEVPVRARWLRTLLAEHTRILSHLGFLGRLTTGTALAGLRSWREQLRLQTLRLTGNRIHPMVARIGGLAADADDDWLRREHELADGVAGFGEQLGEAVEVATGLTGVAVLGREVVAAYGVSGPAARASGIALDLRPTTAGLVYGELAHLIAAPVADTGDAAARFRRFAAEVVESSRLVQACVDRLLGLSGPVEVPLGRVVKLPEGEGYLALEAPLGLAGFYVVSRGQQTPWRFKLRTPSFSNVAALETVLVGVGVRSLEVALASIGYVVGDVDR